MFSYGAQGAVLCWLLMRHVAAIVAIRCTHHDLHME